MSAKEYTVPVSRFIPDDGKVPVQLTVGAYYYESGLSSHVFPFAHPECICETVPGATARETVWKAVATCPMHDTQGYAASVYTAPKFPVTRTVMK